LANAQDFLIFSDAKALYEKTMKSFLQDPQVKSNAEVYKIVQETNAYWEGFEFYLSELIKIEDEINKHMLYVHEKNVQLLNAMDEAVWLYTEHSEDKNDFFIKFQYMALMIGLMIILYSFVIFKEIIEHVESFVQKAKELASGDLSSFSQQGVVLQENSEDELKEASSHISLFVHKVNSAMKDSEEALKKAENAISQLQQLAEEVEETIEDIGIDEGEKKKFDKNINATEDIAIQSAENLIHVNKMLQKLKKSLNAMVETSSDKRSDKGENS
jgi:nitrogen fixation/metabolism regulation signal transduction histidine kinase